MDSENPSESYGDPNEGDFFERSDIFQKRIRRKIEKAQQAKGEKEIEELRDKPEINAVSHELAKGRTNGVKLYKRVDEELRKKKEKIQKLKEVISSRENAKAFENEKLEEIELIRLKRNGVLSPISKKGGNTTPKTPKRTMEEFVNSMNLWTEKKKINIAVQKKLEIDKELKELSFRPNLSKTLRSLTPRTPKRGFETSESKRLGENGQMSPNGRNETKQEQNGRSPLREGAMTPKRQAGTPKRQPGTPNAFERNYQVHDENEEARKRLVEKYLNSTCPFRPKISLKTNRMVREMEKRQFIQKQTGKEGNTPQKPKETKSQTQTPKKTQRVILVQNHENEESLVSFSPNLNRASISPMNSDYKQANGENQDRNVLGSRSGNSKRLQMSENKNGKKINVVEFEPDMESILKKVNEAKGTKTPAKKSSIDKENSKTEAKTPK